MSNDSEKDDQTRKVVVRFLPSLMLLLFVLILTITTWYPALLLLWRFIENKPIITIIILLAGVSLLSFLIQIYMYVDPGKTDKTWKHAVVRFLLLPTLLISVLISVLILSVDIWYPVLLEFPRRLLKDKPIITLLAGVSLLSLLIQIYMYVDPGKVNKTWRQVVTCFMLSLALLVSVIILILIVETWYPDSLPSQVFIEDKPIITIIILLAGVSLLSFLIQRYMKPKEIAKIWKIVARFLLLPALLISVLILIVDTWYPVLLPLWRLIENKPIITIIILLAGVSLLSFLLQRYMNKDPEKVNEIWKIFAYPVHWAFRLVARSVLLLAILLTIMLTLIMTPIFYTISFIYRPDFPRLTTWLLLLPTILVTILISSLILILLLILIFICIGIWNPELLESLLAFISNHWNNLNPAKEDLNIIMIIALLSSIGLFSFLLPKFIKDIKKSLSQIIEKIVEVLRDKWWPKIDIKESLKVTWYCYFARVCPSIKETFAQSQKLFFALLLLCIISVCGYISVNELNKWQENVKDSLVGIRTVTDTIKTVTDTIRTDTANLMILRSSGLSPAYLSGKGDTISLVYPPQGNLNSKKGICPEGDNLIWLKLFKQAILKCAEDSLRKQRPMKLTVQGFASAAPVFLNGDTTNSNSLNCEIANQRAEALIDFLTLPESIRYTEEGCKAVLDSSRIWGRVENKLCIREMPDTVRWKALHFDVKIDTTESRLRLNFAMSDSNSVKQKGKGFNIAYQPWQSYDEMKRAKPVQDSLRLDLEFLNRSVQIIIEEGDCWTKAVDKTD